MEHIVDRPFYNAYAWAYDLLINTRPVSRECACIATLLAQHGVAPGARMLDAGCGTGRYTLELAQRGYVVTGLDLSVPLLMEARKRTSHGRASLSLVCGNLLALPFAPHYDAILCRGVLNDLLHTPSREQVFVSFARVLRPGGVLILDVRDWQTTVLQPGVYAKIRFYIRVEDENGEVEDCGERMWVEVVGKVDKWYRGQLANQPSCTDEIKPGMEVWFQPRHVIDIAAPE